MFSQVVTITTDISGYGLVVTGIELLFSSSQA